MSHLRDSRAESKMFQSLDMFFRISERGSSVSTEIRAGLSTFLTCSYILLVHPQIMAEAGMDARNAVTAACLSSGLATLFIGLVGNFPFVVAPGLGLSTYFTHGLVLNKGSPVTWEQGLGCTLLAGVILTVLSVTFLMDRCMKHIPDYLKTSTTVGIGLFMAGIGYESSGLIVDGEMTNMFAHESWKVWLCLAGLLGIAILKKNKNAGAIVIGVTVTALFYWIASNDWPKQVVEAPSLKNTWAQLRLKELPAKEGASAVATLLLVMMFNSTGCLVAFAMQANLINDVAEPVPRGFVAFLACGLGTCLGALTGCTPLIIIIESTAGILDGGRTGLTAVTTAALLLLSLFFAPLFGSVPGLASAGVLVLIGTYMIAGVKNIDWSKLEVALPSFLMITLMPLSHSISNGVWFGGGAAIAFAIICSSRWQRLGKACGFKCGNSPAESARDEDSEAPSEQRSISDSAQASTPVDKPGTSVTKADVVWSLDEGRVSPSQPSPIVIIQPIPGARRSAEAPQAGLPMAVPADFWMQRDQVPVGPRVWQGAMPVLPLLNPRPLPQGTPGPIYYASAS